MIQRATSSTSSRRLNVEFYGRPTGTASVEKPYEVRRTIIVLDAADLDAESAFWAALLGGTVDADRDWHSVTVDGEWRLGVQLAPNHVAPEWPGGAQQQQIHLDLWVGDLREAHERAIGLGATLLKPTEDPDAAEQFQVYADPAGHPFCLCWAAADSQA